ncbi:hypothetical protein HYDPIDRAFT_32319 [Hydnomerulius pinastri MD-312]|uniref:Adenylate kinase n=1 Tax=Hydnomerulius pinastri MD-312 TaxID=994086 RepID=A0A0C9W2T3_9AGAM|nr:hypothetical protein HYDPIDRAFT_32319 [Hydnomerulius pinastri MD-312]
MSVPPLLGDGHGNYRIHLVGNSGTGKSTIGAYLSSRLNIPLIALDGIFWRPGWEKTPDDEFQAQVRVLMAEDPKGWIIDGDYSGLGTMIPDNATDIIWLDPPLRLYLPRVLWRTLLRLLKIRPTCAEGCPETWGEVFSKKGIVWFCVSNHTVCRTKYTEWLSRMNVEDGGKMIRLDESSGETAKWKAQFEEWLRQR